MSGWNVSRGRATTSIRPPPAVAGMLCLGTPAALRKMVRGSFDSVRLRHAPSKALIGHHAGYVYSVSIAATGWASPAPLRKQITRAVLIGPAHRLAINPT